MVEGAAMEHGKLRGAEKKQEKHERRDLSVEDMLRECEIVPGEPVSLERIERLFERFPVLIEGAKRNYYWDLRRALASDFEQTRIDWWRMGKRPPQKYVNAGRDVAVSTFREYSERSKQSPFAPRTGVLERDALLGDAAATSVAAELTFALTEKDASQSVNLDFVFATDNENARLYRDQGGLFATFTSPDDFRFVGVYTSPNFFSPKQALAEHDRAQGVSYDRVKQMVEWLVPFPDTDIREAITVLRQLAARDGLPSEMVEKLEMAMQEFASFVKPAPQKEDVLGEIGRCLTVPHTFASFCKEKFGIEMEREEYGSGISFYHQVNRLGNVVIDWTAGQYSAYRDAPYPRVYHLDEPLLDGIIPRSQWTQEMWDEVREHERLIASGREY